MVAFQNYDRLLPIDNEHFADLILGWYLPLRKKFSALNHSAISSTPKQGGFNRRRLSFDSLPTECTGIHINISVNIYEPGILSRQRFVSQYG